MVICGVRGVTMAPCIHLDCIYTNAGSGFTMGSAGSYFFMNPKSGVAGNNLPVWTWDGGVASRADFRLGSGGGEVENMKAGDWGGVEIAEIGRKTASLRVLAMTTDITTAEAADVEQGRGTASARAAKAVAKKACEAADTAAAGEGRAHMVVHSEGGRESRTAGIGVRVW